MFEPAITKATQEKFDLGWSDHFIATPHVWMTDTTVYPWYAFCNGGTNRLVILKYEEEWEEIKLEDIPSGHLHPLLWKWTLLRKESGEHPVW